MKSKFFAELPALLSVVGGVTAWQEQLDWGLRIVVAVVAVLAGASAAWRFVQTVWRWFARRKSPAV